MNGTLKKVLEHPVLSICSVMYTCWLAHANLIAKELGAGVALSTGSRFQDGIQTADYRRHVRMTPRWPETSSGLKPQCA